MFSVSSGSPFDPTAQQVESVRSILDVFGSHAARQLARELRPPLVAFHWHEVFDIANRYSFEGRVAAIARWHSGIDYQARRLAQLHDGDFQYWVYSSTLCWSHRHLNSIVLPPDHPFWTSFFPANGWHCNCSVYGCRNEAGIARLGGDPTKQLPLDWATVDQKTGLPVGIGAGFGSQTHPDLEAGLLALFQGRHECHCDLPPTD